ncbi:MAG: hypothetical protein F4X07_06125 [Acidimicrobiaceae bacterium]|nr:hypothetical protein [Acidimicrobiaceae bacterium]
MYEAIGGEAFHCRIVSHVRTRAFEFPAAAFQPDPDEAHHMVYASPVVQAHVASNLVAYFEQGTSSRHYGISPSLRHEVRETEEKIKSQNKGHTPLFLVIEESNQLTPVEMVNGECHILDEVVVRDGKPEPLLIGGRKGERFLIAWATSDGAWPDIPNNQKLANMILAGVRVGQQTADPILRYLDHEGLVTDSGRFVGAMRLTSSARLSSATPMDSKAYRNRVSEIRAAITAMERDIHVPHMALLVNAMYRDDYNDDSYQRLHYLQLWQSLTEAGKKVLGYQGKSIKHDNKVVSGERTLRELTEYRNDVAHWWTDKIDENCLADLQRTVNELVRSKYF